MIDIYFLNVGHGDCTIINHDDGHVTMIDINNGEELDDESAAEIAETLGYRPEDIYNLASLQRETPYELLKARGYNRELTNPVHFLKKILGKTSIFRYIQTHPDLDHMRGISALKAEGITIVNFWDTTHEKEPENFLSGDQEDWDIYQSFAGGNGTKVLRLHRNAKGHYYNDHPTDGSDGDGIYIFSPTPELVESVRDSKKWNNLSYVLKLNYKGCKVVFGGDAEDEAWDSIVTAHKDELKCNVLKASHHGRKSGFHEEAVKLMNPDFTIVSVGKKPETDSSEEYKKYTNKGVWSTRWKGNIHLSIDDNGQGVLIPQYDNG